MTVISAPTTPAAPTTPGASRRATRAWPRLLAQGLTVALLTAIFVVPLAVVVLASLARSWSGFLPQGLSVDNFRAVFADPATSATITVSVLTAVAATAVSLLLALLAALGARSSRGLRKVCDTVFVLPVAAPSVAIGLAILLAFSRSPWPLNGTLWIVLLAHVVLCSTLTYQPLSAAVQRLDPALEEGALVLGAGRARVLFRVIVPALRPALCTGAALSLAMSMGELTASMMLAPASWRTMPLQIFAFTSRGIRLYEGAALAVILMALTCLIVALLSIAAAQRRRR